MGKLTDLQVKNATCPAGQKIKKYHDGQGLYLWCTADGGRWWRLRYYVGGKERGMALGSHPKVSLAQARAEADKQRKILAGGADPAAAKRQAKAADKAAAADTLEAVAAEWFANVSHRWVAKHARIVWTRLETHVFPSLGKMPVKDIGAPDLIATLRKIQQGGAEAIAFRVLGDIRRINDYAINCGRLDKNIAIGREGALKTPTTKNRAHVSQKEFPALVQAIASYTGERKTQLALQLAMMTFVRANELLLAQWSEFDFDNLIWEIPAERMKMGKTLLVPLAPQVVDILNELKAMNPTSEFILPGARKGRAVSQSALLGALKQLGYGGKQTVHGFRHVASTALHEARDGDHKLFHSDAIERQLAHVAGGVRSVYDKSELLPERRRIMTWWAQFVCGLLSARNKDGDR